MTVRIEMKPGALRKLRYSSEAKGLCEQHGRRVLLAANSTLPEGVGYQMSSRAGVPRPWGRWRVSVGATSTHAKRSNARHNTLLRVLG